MDRMMLAAEILKIAKSLVSIEFPTQDAMDKYLKDHPDADRSNHRVVETKKQAPAKKEAPVGKVPEKEPNPKHSIYDISDDSKVHEKYWEDIQLAVEESRGKKGKAKSALAEISKKYKIHPKMVENNFSSEASENDWNE